jgi:hypothetical protein
MPVPDLGLPGSGMGRAGVVPRWPSSRRMASVMNATAGPVSSPLSAAGRGPGPSGGGGSAILPAARIMRHNLDTTNSSRIRQQGVAQVRSLFVHASHRT